MTDLSDILFWRRGQKRGNYIEINVAQIENNPDVYILAQEFKKAVNNINRLSESQYTFDLNIYYK